MSKISVDFKIAFEALPGIHILINTDTDYTVLAVTQGLINIQPHIFSRDKIVNNPFFEAFPQSAEVSSLAGENSIRSSFQYVIANKKQHTLNVQRYEVPDDNCGFTERWWSAVNNPVLNDDGEVIYIIQSSVEITEQLIADKRIADFKEIDKAYQLFMNAPVAVCIVKGAEYIVELVNDGMLQLLGRTKKVINRPLIESLTEADLQGLIKILDVVRTTGQPYQVSTFPAILLINGERVSLYLDLVFQPYLSGNNSGESSIFCQAQNVTEQVMDRKKVQEITERLNYRNAIFEAQKEATPDAINVVDLNGKIIFYNNRFAQLWKLPQEIIDSKDDEAALKHAMTLLKDPEEFIKRVETLYQQKKEISYDEIYFKDGRVIERNGSSIVGENGVKYGWAWYFRDITERKKAAEILEKSEARTRLAIEAARLGTFDVNIINQSIFYTPRVAEIFGFSADEKISYSNFIDLIHPDDKEIRQAAHVKAMQTGDLFYEARIILADKSVKWIRLNGKYTFVESKPESFVGTLLDITEEKKAADLLEFKIEERTVELKQANEQLKQFTYAASHDLQEPLRKISFFLDRLLSGIGPTNEENKKTADRILTTTARMRSLIDDLLHYSNSTFGAVTFNNTDLTAVVQDVLDDMEATIIEKAAVITVDNLPVVNGDSRQLKQLFQNIIGNALKYQKNITFPKVTITSKVVKRNTIHATTNLERNEDLYYKIIVTDNGIGFEQEYAERIFKLFQRLHSKHEFEGTGIGLALVQKVVENHNGFITAESKLDEGSSFNIFLPLVQLKN